MSTVDVVCRGTFTDRATGETVHAHDRRVCHTFRLAPILGREILIMHGNQWIDRTDDTPLPDDFELLLQVAEDEPDRPITARLAINCPACPRGLTVAHTGLVSGVVKALAGHGVPEVDMESLRGYTQT